LALVAAVAGANSSYDDHRKRHGASVVVASRVGCLVKVASRDPAASLATRSCLSSSQWPQRPLNQ